MRLSVRNLKNIKIKKQNSCQTEPGFYKQGEFGVRLKNMMEVYDDNKKLPNGQKLLSIRQLSIVPYESKLIDLALLTVDEVGLFMLILIYSLQVLKKKHSRFIIYQLEKMAERTQC